jgi:hypothetical protein
VSEDVANTTTLADKLDALYNGACRRIDNFKTSLSATFVNGKWQQKVRGPRLDHYFVIFSAWRRAVRLVDPTCITIAYFFLVMQL